MSTQLTLGASAMTGAALQEVLWWYNLRRRLADKEIALFHSMGYWAITIGFIVMAGAVSLAWFDGNPASPKDALVFGAFLPAILKQAGRAAVPERPLGSDKNIRPSKPRFRLSEYLG